MAGKFVNMALRGSVPRDQGTRSNKGGDGREGRNHGDIVRRRRPGFAVVFDKVKAGIRAHLGVTLFCPDVMAGS